jgi:glycosyltransferase involved in cell wall biosynthesis
MIFPAGELERDVRRTIAGTPELSGRVTLVGPVPHARVACYLSAADLLVAGSRREGSGYAVIEGLACGTVPVITDIAPFRALTDNGRVGAIWTPGDPASLAVALSRVTARPLAPQQQSVRRLFDDEFSWPVIGRRAVAHYEAAIAERRARHGVRTGTRP